jgi:hypothetical protein
MRLFEAAEGLAIGVIGRPLLWTIKQFRLVFLLFGFGFNTLVVYYPSTGEEITSPTFVPLLVGIVLYSVGAAVQRYDDLVSTFYKLHPFPSPDR